MVNVTISLSEALKSKMDEHRDVNWSKVCREAIEARINMLENPFPKIKAELREIRFSYDKVKPGLILDLVFKNEMQRQLMLDRMWFEVYFIPTPGTELSVGSSMEVRKGIVPMGKWTMNHFVKIDSDTILLIDEQLTRTFKCAANITTFFEDFQGYTTTHAIKIPIDEWQRFVEHVVEIEREKLKIREKRLLRTVG